MTEDTITEADRLEMLERIVARNEAERQAAEKFAERLEEQRTKTLSELGRETERRQAEAAAERNRQNEEYSRRYDEQLRRAQPRMDAIRAELRKLNDQEKAERDRSAAQLEEALSTVTHRKLEIAREMSALQEPPSRDVSPEPTTARSRLRALVGGRN
jgi:hypothetical protein